MAKESMKARERKRERLVAKYAAKRAALKEAGDWEGLQKLPPTLLRCVCTTVVKSRVVPVASCVSSASAVSCSARWPFQDASLA